jgi:AraC family transcriptional regulator
VTSSWTIRPTSQALLADYPPGAEFGPRVLPSFEFVWLLTGSARWQWTRTGGERGDTLLRPGTLALSTPGIRDRYVWDPDRSTRHAYLHFHLDGDPADLPAYARWPLTRELAETPVLAGLTDYLLDLAAIDTETARRRTADVVGLLLTIFVAGPLRTAPVNLGPHLTAVVDHVRQVWADGMRIVTVSELCTATDLSAGHLHRLFRDRFGCGPARALELIRLARSAVALQRSNRTLTEIAELVGFSNPYHFSRRFTAVYRTPPGAYRRRLDADDPYRPVRHAGLLPMSHRLLGSD